MRAEECMLEMKRDEEYIEKVKRKSKLNYNIKQVKTHKKSRTLKISIIIMTTLFFSLFLLGIFINEDAFAVDLNNTFRSPSFRHLFGTDWMGRDMLFRTLKGLSRSISIGIFSALLSGLIAAILGILAPMFGPKIDGAVSWIVDLVLSIPHTILMILISVAVGGGKLGIMLGITLTHWTSLTRVIRAEVLQVMESDYTKVSKQLGKSKWFIAKEHILPHILRSLFVGIILVFPHAILHEAAITFLGFGLPPHEPAVGVILSESMKYLTSGKWWLAFFPGVILITVSMIVEKLGKELEKEFS